MTFIESCGLKKAISKSTEKAGHKVSPTFKYLLNDKLAILSKQLCVFKYRLIILILRMFNLIGTIVGYKDSENISWEIVEYYDEFIDDGITITFIAYETLTRKEAVNYLRDLLMPLNIGWLYYKTDTWLINLDLLKSEFGRTLKPKNHEESDSHIFVYPIKRNPEFSLDLLTGVIKCNPEIGYDVLKDPDKLKIVFTLTTEYLIECMPKKTFLSHKGIDKPRVRDYKNALLSIGFDPWLDEDAMPAGTQLERGLLQGFKNSCAAIFFITPNYVDENFLATEIDYAIAEKRIKKDKFSIITLVVDENAGKYVIPDLLKPYVWKTPKNDLDAIKEILLALPIKPMQIEYK